MRLPLAALIVAGVSITDKKKRMEERQKKREAAAPPGEQGEYQFPMPVFDEGAFRLRETTSAWISLAGIGLGFLMGIPAALLQPYYKLWFIGVVFLVLGGAALRPIVHLAGIDTSKMKGMDWAGQLMTIAFAFLGSWILFLNL